MIESQTHHQAMVQSLRQRYSTARQSGDADILQALFREAVYLGVQPELLDPVVDAKDLAASAAGS
ncbi:hypothetical protein KQ302_01455 [Synechococcus sp. CS-602]|uniref:hypothetical protein n=1 Tax=Synechococcaceae TaxID=1890426 RepID=UPI00223B1C8F|nr:MULTISPECIES: hypothetical protein [Synechococcaceae]MCT0203786.1 hypothetical protein [Synechococcus sp. CS-602]MCT4364340.1 hypothetical protein [Candidatus Regnicoccus frigidus MAG-AL1]MCT4366273.1 hypothetical protein [Candidatus Regnicoccus frigidus MAG-AL2]